MRITAPTKTSAFAVVNERSHQEPQECTWGPPKSVSRQTPFLFDSGIGSQGPPRAIMKRREFNTLQNWRCSMRRVGALHIVDWCDAGELVNDVRRRFKDVDPQ